MSLHPRIQEVTERIRQRSALLRRTYLDGIDAAHREGPQRARLPIFSPGGFFGRSL